MMSFRLTGPFFLECGLISCEVLGTGDLLCFEDSHRNASCTKKREFLGEIVNNLILQNMFNLMKARSFRWEGGQIQRLLG